MERQSLPGHDIIVIGASAGGMQALSRLVSQLPAGLPAAIFVVWHVAPYVQSVLPEVLSRAGNLPAHHPEDKEPIRPGRIYVAPPDHHLLLEAGRVRLTHGPKENRFRPAVDTLFRTAAYAFGPRVVGVVLTGALNDGTAGLWAIKDRGGVAIVQDPKEAEYDAMPRSAMEHVEVDYCLPLAEIAPALVRLTKEPAKREGDYPVSDQLKIESQVAFEDNAIAAGVMKLGEPSAFACPDCHGTLIRIKESGLARYRCHTGHAYSAESLLAELSETVEDALWSALRGIEEVMMLLNHLAEHEKDAGRQRLAELIREKVDGARERADLVRRAAMGHEVVSLDKLRRGD